jgi:hypothetical protein
VSSCAKISGSEMKLQNNERDILKNTENSDCSKTLKPFNFNERDILRNPEDSDCSKTLKTFNFNERDILRNPEDSDCTAVRPSKPLISMKETF